MDDVNAAEAAPYLRALVDGQALALCDVDGEVLAWTGPYSDLGDTLRAGARRAIDGERQVLVSDLPAPHRGERVLIVEPLVVEGAGVIGVLGVLTAADPGPGLLGVVTDVARYASTQIELAELDLSRARLDRAEVLALRAQISPHFIYNALNTIASFVRTDPDRARELVLEFADFTRYSFRTAGEYTTLADELRNIDRYLTLERARFGDALQVKLQVAPRCSTRWSRFSHCNRWWRTPCATVSPAVPAAAPSASWRRTRAPSAWSAWRTTASGWTRNCCAPARWTR